MKSKNKKPKNMDVSKYPLVSIIMLNYNGLNYLKKTIKPILNLDYPNFEFIIVDNGSDDGSVNFIKSFKKIKLIRNETNLGYSQGKNIGFDNSIGKYVLSLDNDILIKDNQIISKLLNLYTKTTGFIQIPLLDKNYESTKYYGIFYSIYGPTMHNPMIKINKIISSPNTLVDIVGPVGGCFFCSKINWKKIGGFDESQKFNLDDFDIGPRSYIFGFKNYLYTKEYFIHLGVNKSNTALEYSNRIKTLFSGQARAIIKNYSFWRILWSFPFFFTFQFIKAIRFSINKRSLKIFLAFLYSIKFFFLNFLDTLIQRKAIQSKRTVKKDIFFNIPLPRFD